jgi:Holliday junction resolvase
MNGQRFERDIVKCFNTHFDIAYIHAIAYRFERASRFSIQPADILVDSREKPYYCAIECKSMEGDKLYFSSAFSDATKIPQLERMNTFLIQSGRKGYIAIEVRQNRHLNAWILDFQPVYEAFKGVWPGLSLDTIRHLGQKLTRSQGTYSL